MLRQKGGRPTATTEQGKVWIFAGSTDTFIQMTKNGDTKDPLRSW